jgi:hypothetical protein
MQESLTRIDIGKLQKQLGRLRIACAVAIESGDCQAVARLTCETARLVACINLARTVELESV